MMMGNKLDPNYAVFIIVASNFIFAIICIMLTKYFKYRNPDHFIKNLKDKIEKDRKDFEKKITEIQERNRK